MILTDQEKDILVNSPVAIQMLIDYHDCQQSMGEAMGFDCSYHIKRREELGRVKATLEAADE